jgi:hypothetical protein
MTHNSDNQEVETKVASKKSISSLVKWLLAILGTIIASAITAYVTTCTTIHLETKHERPDIKILGAMPIHLYGSHSGPDKTKFRIHKLAFIFKLENSSPTYTIVHMAMFEGCIPLPPSVAESHLPKSQRTPSGTNTNVFYEKHKKTIQKISSSAAVRQDTRVVPAHGTAYVGTFFSLPTRATYFTVKDSISLKGICEEIKVSNPHPAISQVFETFAIQYELPKDIRAEFRNGRLKLVLFIGSEIISISPDKIRPMQSLRLERWEDLAFPQMYENPDEGFPPRKHTD